MDINTIISKNISKPVVVLDCETTGLSVEKDEIIQFGAIKLYPDGKIAKLQFLCKPSVPIPVEASNVHKIKDADVKDCKPFSAYKSEVEKLIKNSTICGFNSDSFDIAFLEKHLGQKLNNDTYDAYKIYKKHSSRTLTDALKFYTGKEGFDAHDAMADVEATLEIIAFQIEKEKCPLMDIKKKKENKKMPEFKHIIEKDGKYILNFSKHKGLEMSKVDKGFLSWMLKKDFPTEIKDIIRKFV